MVGKWAFTVFFLIFRIFEIFHNIYKNKETVILMQPYLLVSPFYRRCVLHCAFLVSHLTPRKWGLGSVGRLRLAPLPWLLQVAPEEQLESDETLPQGCC